MEVVIELRSLISVGSLFHDLGAATKKDRSPRVLRDFKAGQFNVKDFVERRQYLLNDTSLIEINSLI